MLKANQIHVVYLDKNHPPGDGINSATSFIDEFMPKHIEYTKLYLLPEIKNENIPGLPFSAEFYAQVFSNGLNRQDHETLDNSNIPLAFAINMMFLRFNKAVRFDRNFAQENGIHYLPLPLTNESISV